MKLYVLPFLLFSGLASAACTDYLSTEQITSLRENIETYLQRDFAPRARRLKALIQDGEDLRARFADARQKLSWGNWLGGWLGAGSPEFETYRRILGDRVQTWREVRVLRPAARRENKLAFDEFVYAARDAAIAVIKKSVLGPSEWVDELQFAGAEPVALPGPAVYVRLRRPAGKTYTVYLHVGLSPRLSGTLYELPADESRIYDYDEFRPGTLLTSHSRASLGKTSIDYRLEQLKVNSKPQMIDLMQQRMAEDSVYRGQVRRILAAAVERAPSDELLRAFLEYWRRVKTPEDMLQTKFMLKALDEPIDEQVVIASALTPELEHFSAREAKARLEQSGVPDTLLIPTLWTYAPEQVNDLAHDAASHLPAHAGGGDHGDGGGGSHAGH